MLFIAERPCTSCRWVRRPLTDRLFAEGDRATCAHPEVVLDGKESRPRCVETRDYLAPCGPAGKFRADTAIKSATADVERAIPGAVLTEADLSRLPTRDRLVTINETVDIIAKGWAGER